MQTYFNELADHLTANLTAGEVFTASYGGETSDFVRFNQSKVRQPGRVVQHYLGMDLIDGARHASATTTLSGVKDEDLARLSEMLRMLRERLPLLPEDPHLLYATEVNDSVETRDSEIPDADAALAKVLEAGEGRDLVGIWAAGDVSGGFANSLGQRNWYSSSSFNLDWSFYLKADKAVKTAYAGSHWDHGAFERKVSEAAAQLTALSRESKTIEPGRYRVYMSPVALADFIGMLGWGGFGLKSHRTKRTSLLKMVEDGTKLSPAVTISENTAEGVAPNFQGDGFLKPDRVVMIDGGEHRDCLVSPRSAKEYDVATNGANSMEFPESLDLAGGDLAVEDVLSTLDTGVLINNVWYLNYSDRPGGRITGMTRFACFWVENGEIVAPVNVMRFDETVFRAMGENLVGLTNEPELILDSGTYGGRSTASARIPGAVIEDFNFNL